MKKDKIDLLRDLTYCENLYSDEETTEWGLLSDLREKEGLNEEKVINICEILKELADEWKNVDTIPKKAVEVFMDLCDGKYNSLHLYQDDEAETSKINDAFRIIRDYLRFCVQRNT